MVLSEVGSSDSKRKSLKLKKYSVWKFYGALWLSHSGAQKTIPLGEPLYFALTAPSRVRSHNPLLSPQAGLNSEKGLGLENKPTVDSSAFDENVFKMMFFPGAINGDFDRLLPFFGHPFPFVNSQFICVLQEVPNPCAEASEHFKRYRKKCLRSPERFSSCQNRASVGEALPAFCSEQG